MGCFRTVTANGVVYDIQRIDEHRESFSKRGVTCHAISKAHYVTTRGLKVAKINDNTFKIIALNTFAKRI